MPDFKLFGVLTFERLLQNLGFDHLPEINTIELPTQIVRKWNWSAPLKTENFGILTFDPESSVTSRYKLNQRTIELPTPAKRPPETSVPTECAHSEVSAYGLLDLIELKVASEFQAHFQLRRGCIFYQPPRLTPSLARPQSRFLVRLLFISLSKIRCRSAASI